MSAREGVRVRRARRTSAFRWWRRRRAERLVIAYGKGGALETVRDVTEQRATGMFFDEQSADAIIAAVERFDAHVKRFFAAGLPRERRAFLRGQFPRAPLRPCARCCPRAAQRDAAAIRAVCTGAR